MHEILETMHQPERGTQIRVIFKWLNLLPPKKPPACKPSVIPHLSSNVAEGKVKPLKKEVKEEEEDEYVPPSRPKAMKKEEPVEHGDDEDNAPIALSKSRISKSKCSSKVKKEEDLSEVENVKDHKVKSKEGGKNVRPVSKVKRRGADDSDEDDLKEKKKLKKKKKGEEEVAKKSKGSIAGAKVKERKVYDLPGQKHDPPEQRDPLRIFYETLYQQLPGSEMAALWMMEWGLLPLNEAKKVHEKKLQKAQLQKLGSPVKAVTVKKTSTTISKEWKLALKSETKVAKRKAAETDDDDNFVVARTTKKQKASI